MLSTHTDSVSTLKSSQHLCLGLSHPSKPAPRAHLAPRAYSHVVCRAAFPEQVCLRCDILRPAQVCASPLTLTMIVLDTETRAVLLNALLATLNIRKPVSSLVPNGLSVFAMIPERNARCASTIAAFCRTDRHQVSILHLWIFARTSIPRPHR